MNIQEQLLNCPPELVSQKEQASDSTTPTFENPTWLKRGGTLRQRLLMTIVPTALIPLVVASAIGINITRYRVQKDELSKLESIVMVGRELGKEFSSDLVETKVNPLTIEAIDQYLISTVGFQISGSESLQLINGNTGQVSNTLSTENSSKSEALIGGEVIAQVAKILIQSNIRENYPEILLKVREIPGISQVKLQNSVKKTEVKILTFESRGQSFIMTPLPDTDFVAVASVEPKDMANSSQELILVFASTAFFLGFLAVGNIILLAQTLSQPLINLTEKAQQAADGDLKVEANFEGTEENRTLAYNFNTLVTRVKELIAEQEAIANQQREEKEKLEAGIYQLLDEVQNAVDGDLTVRASLSSMEMSTVADLFNAVLDSLQDIAIQVRKSSSQVSLALREDEQSLQKLAKEAIKEAEKTRNTLTSVEQMSQTIEEVASNANQAATLADNAYIETQEGSKAMAETVNSILSLRTTVGDTAKKMKRLGESSQKISQVVSLIEEIALKTNLLAINASVEASRAGEQGQGFTVVAEQVGALAEQSSTAIKEIAQIVAEIQGETQEVTQAMELGTSEVVNTTRLVESTKQLLAQVLQRSSSINELMRNISQSTISQAETSHLVTELMQEIAQQSEQRLTSSQQIAQSMQATAQVAQQLESAVEQFKVN